MSNLLLVCLTAATQQAAATAATAATAAIAATPPPPKSALVMEVDDFPGWRHSYDAAVGLRKQRLVRHNAQIYLILALNHITLNPNT